MSFYSAKTSEKLRRARHVGKLPNAGAVGTSASFLCGTFVRFYLTIDKADKKIAEARFQTSGCGYSIAAAEVLCEKITGRKLVELRGADEDFLRRQIESELEEFSADRAHCLEICLDALHAAFADFRAAQIEERSNETDLICACFGISEKTIEDLIAEKSLETVEEVTKNCGACGGCGACRALIQEILDVAELENF